MYRITGVVGFRPTPKAQDVINAERSRRRLANPNDKKSLSNSAIVNYLLETRGESRPTPRLPNSVLELYHTIQCPKDDSLNTLAEITAKCRICEGQRRCVVHTGIKF